VHQLALEFVALLLHRADGFVDGQFLGDGDGIHLGFQCLDFGILLAGGLLQLLSQARLGQLLVGQLFLPGLLQVVGQLVTLALHVGHGFGHGHLLRHLAGFQARFQFLDLGIAGRGRLLQLGFRLGARQFDGVALVLLGQFQALMQLLLEGAVATCERMSA
jgi:hypothetical protein